MNDMKKVWEIKERKFEEISLQLLYNRNIISGKAEKDLIKKFLEPDFENDFHDPSLLPDWTKLEKRILEAVKNKEKIGIFADYDADGIPGAAFLYKSLKQLALCAEVYIPTREEGYGLNKQGIDLLINKGCTLIITVDLGIKAFEMADYLQGKCDLIITDHHLPDDKLPAALAVVNPKVVGSKYPFIELSGAGVVFKIVQGLAQKFPKELTESFLKWNLDLIAISTISDVVPLVDENRIIAKYGIISLAKTKNLGLQELYKVAAFDPEKMNTYAVGFQIAPRINAPGRIDHATKSFELLISEDEKEAHELANWLNEKNQLRQESMDEVEAAAIKEILERSLDKNNIIIISGKWPKGVIGPSASRLVERFRRPVIILSEEKDGYSGSSRSLPCFNIVARLKQAEQYLTLYGGHKGAAGLSLKADQLENFEREMIAIANREIKAEDLLPRINIDLEIKTEELTIKQFEVISKLEPFGLGNPRPVFYLRNVKLVDHRFVGRENKHLKLTLESSGKQIEGIYFSCGLDPEDIKSNQEYDIVFNPEINRWNGSEKVSLNISDMKESNGE
jgi:single-stranded-DNA-specific exonuclease